jgi:uncharacterized membrane protein YqhA
MPLPQQPSPALRPLPALIFASRWLQLPLYLGLIAAQAVYVFHFWVELVHLLEAVFGNANALQALITSIGYKTDVQITSLNETIIMLVVLALIDVVMISNLLIMVIVGGYETFVSRMNLEGHPDQPEWLSHVNASVLKVKLATAIIGISSIHLLKTFINAARPSTRSHPAERPAARARAAARCGQTRCRPPAGPGACSLSARCFSPTRRWLSTSTSSLKVGGAKPWPQTSRCSVSTRSARRYSGASGPSVSMRRVSVAASSHSRATCCSACSKVSKCSSPWCSRRHGVAAEAQQHAGVALGDQVQRVAQVKAGDRAARALEFTLLARRAAGGKHEGGAVQLVLDARGDDADHAFVESRGRTR